ncbi:MAG: NUDIX hydrolase [Saprospiraceae bacterium]|nr:NUDIX hydrolase [Saprospiraceae bacterium]
MMKHDEPQPWRVTDSRYVLDRKPYMVLREDTVMLPNGTRIDDYFIFEYPDWLNTIAITEDGLFVLIRQYRHGLQQVHYELAGGVADPGEAHLAGAQRELLEETGYGGGEWRLWVELCPNPATHTNTCHIFLATGVRRIAQQDLDGTEEISVCLLSVQEVLEMLRTGGVSQALHAAALWRYFAENGTPGQPAGTTDFEVR